MITRLTRKQMKEQYPSQWVVLENVEYMNNDGVTVMSGEVIQNNLTEDEALSIQLNRDDAIAWYTSDDTGISIGMVGAM